MKSAGPLFVAIAGLHPLISSSDVPLGRRGIWAAIVPKGIVVETAGLPHNKPFYFISSIFVGVELC